MLKSDKIPENLKIVSKGAFNSCNRLKAMFIPACVKGIVNFVFSGCYILYSIVILENEKCIDEYAYQNCNYTTEENIYAKNRNLRRNSYSELHCKMANIDAEFLSCADFDLNRKINVKDNCNSKENLQECNL